MVDAPARTAVLVDPHTLWLETVQRVLAHVGVQTVAKLSGPSRALVAVRDTRSDLLVIEPLTADERCDGLECIRAARAALPALKVVALSAAEDAGAIASAFSAGACVYVVKRSSAADLAAAIRQAFDASIYVHAPHVVAAALGRDLGSCALTRREREILCLVAEGRTNAEAAKELWVTEQTVKFHLANVCRKLGVANRTEAARWAHANGVFDGARTPN